MTFAASAIRFHASLHYSGGPLPEGIRVMNPFQEDPSVMEIANLFFNKYYNDDRTRHLILGINPGRFGAGLTGIPFTDPKRLISECGIPYTGKMTHEPSSVFVYDMINAYGGPRAFYNDFYINSPCPLGFTSVRENGKEVNYNYYDSRELIVATTPFIIESIIKLINLGIETNFCFCLGTGKNAAFLQKLNDQHHFFKKIIPLEHPRFIMQYKLRSKDLYIKKYLEAFDLVRR
jgi:hypothetical protein